jgi:hypothetical protein
MTNFEGLKNLFIMFKVKHTPKKHWIDSTRWGRIEFMNELLMESTQNVVIVANFIYVSIDEVIAIYNTSWISLHLYVVQGWKQIPLLACVENVGVQRTTENIFYLMFIAMVTFGGLNVEQLGTKLISMGCDGNNVFQVVRAGVTMQMKENVAPFLMGIHSFVH